MADETNTLIVKHLPDLSDDDKEDLLKHFGAVNVHCMGKNGSMRNVAFAMFECKEDAQLAMERLHQLEVMNCRLVVEFSKKQYKQYHPSCMDVPGNSEKNVKEFLTNDKEKPNIVEMETSLKKEKINICNKLNSQSVHWDMEYPLNPTLKYSYPLPTVNILTNIANALASVPKFYVQVLHLMNKMNLPAPFGAITSTPPIPQGDPIPRPPEPNSGAADMDVSSSEESELETSDDGNENQNRLEKKPLKRKLPRDPTIPIKKHKIQKIVSVPKSQTLAQVSTKEVFEQPEVTNVLKKIEIKYGAVEESPVCINDKPVQQDIPEKEGVTSGDEMSVTVPSAGESGFGKIEPLPQPEQEEEEEEEEWGESRFVSSRRLKKDRISRSEMREIAVFKNYDRGEPTPRIYIKNLAKKVTETDLHYVFGRYVDWENESETNMFDIRLMKEGRMKGQAFVTLPSEKKALAAVEDVHGFMLHDKPMAVQFARSAKPKSNDPLQK